MKNLFSRRNFLQSAAITTTTAMIPGVAGAMDMEKSNRPVAFNKNPLKIGIMTYNLAKNWDIETIIKNCTEAGFLSTELRTTHKHGVEVTLTTAEREAVKKRFKESSLETISLASAFAYHFPDQGLLRENIEGTKEYVLLARDIGATGIRVFPNAVPEGVPEEKTLKQIGKALAEVSEYANQFGVEIRVCVHGKGTNSVALIKKIIDYSDSPYVYVNWNCDPLDSAGKGFIYNFNSVKDRIRGVHLHELWVADYPYRLLFKLLSEMGYQGYCNAEVNESKDDPIRFMKYYRALFLAYQNAI
ncbi:MAG: sugar phosphate isomerase/epimerase family protein [Mangrovibacterium sp.]